MAKIDTLLKRVKRSLLIFDRLMRDNPFQGMSYEELRRYMRPNAPKVLINESFEKGQYNVALLEARCWRLLKEGERYGKT